MKTNSALLLLLHLIFIPFFSSGQQKEWMHLHFDKDIYLPGETIWFKAYLYAVQKPSLSTGNLYIALYNEEGKLLDQKHYPVFDGTSTGDFALPDSLASDLVQVKAFTKNMFLADSQHIYSRIIQVYQKPNSKQTITIPAQATPGLKIFPEGGTLINGVTNYIALKAIYEREPLTLPNAAIVTGKGTFIDSVFFNGMGIGTLQFIPSAGENYWAVWKDNQGMEHKTAFPAAIENGVALHSEISGNRIYYSLQKNSHLVQLDLLHLSILAGNEILYKETIAMKDEQKFVHSFVTDSLPAGIFSLILSDNLANIVQQKLIYIKNIVPPPAVKIIEKSNQPKGKNVVEIQLNDTLLTNLSLSIADLGFYQEEPVVSISDELLLQNNSTNLYRSFPDPKATNLVLLTQEQAETTKQETMAKDGYLSFSLNYRDNNHALPDASLLTLIINDKANGKQFLNLSPVSHTSFLASDLICYDSAKIYYQLAGRKELTENMVVSIPPEMNHPDHVKPVRSALSFSQRNYNSGDNNSITRYLDKHEKFNELQTLKAVVMKTRYVNPVTKRLLELDDKYATSMFRGLARGYQLNALDDPAAERSVDAFSYIVYRIPGLTAKGPFGGRKIYGRNGPPILFINEAESPAEMLETVNTSQLAYIKYIPGIVIGASFTSSDGALYVYTKKGNENNITRTMKSFYIKGYDLPKEFTLPDYSSKQNSLNPDYRSTLYWNPYIITDKKNNSVRIEYYNNDLAGKQLLTLRGFNAAGELIELYKQID